MKKFLLSRQMCLTFPRRDFGIIEAAEARIRNDHIRQCDQVWQFNFFAIL